MEKIKVYNLGNLPVAPVDSFFELQEDFKISDPDKLAKLQMLIITRGFKYAFKAWKDPEGKLWIIDAHQRKKALLSLRKSGFDIPPIPYEPIFAASKKEAVEEIAAYNSEFGKKNPDTLLFQKYKIDTDTLSRFSLDFKPKAIELEPVQSIFDKNDINSIKEDDFDVEESIKNFEDQNEEPFSKKGDLWILGEHRLFCGDCRFKKNVDTLMNGRYADTAVTDPPYNVNYTGSTKDKLTIENDSMSKDDFLVFITAAYQNLFHALRPGGSYYIFHADSEGANFRIGLQKVGFKFAQCLIWEKNTFCMGRQDYQWQHEPILYGWKPGAAHTWLSDRKQSTILRFDKPIRNADHPTMKPIALMAYPILNSCPQGRIVIDFFLGSGTTLLAAQQTDRICYAMEVDPIYTDVSVKRFMKSFPDIPVKCIRNGEELKISEISL